VKRETQLWLDHAAGDFAMAELGRGHGLYGQCIFHCQQAVEKTLKALWIERREDAHPKTHVLPELVKQLDLDIDDEQLSFFQRLSDQYLPSHYAGYNVEYPEEAAEYYYKGASEICIWLRQLLN
jgi:HEPN domain-containing protein